MEPSYDWLFTAWFFVLPKFPGCSAFEARVNALIILFIYTYLPSKRMIGQYPLLSLSKHISFLGK